MKRTGLLETLAVAVLACGFVGCVDVTDGTPPGSANVIAFSSPATSRAAVNSANDMSAFSVWGWYDRTAEGGSTVFDGAIVSRDGDTWNTDVTRYWIENKIYDFYAVHPAEAAMSGSKGAILVVEQFDATKGVDLMTASKTGETYAANRGPVELSFEHQLAKVTVAVRAEQGVMAQVEEVKLYGVYTTADFMCGFAENGGDEQWDNPGTICEEDDTQLVSEGTPTVTNGAEATVLSDLLMIPQRMDSAKLYVKVTQGNRELEKTLDLYDFWTQWEAGHAYNCVLSVSSNNITFAGFTVDGWGESHAGGDINIDTAE